MKRLTLVAMLTGLLVTVSTSYAQDVTVDVNDASAWQLVQDPDTEATFGYDYSQMGIPAAPGSDDTLGLRMAVNIESGAVAALSATPRDLSLAGTYTVSVDAWLNYYADPGKVGTTEFSGLFVGFDPAGPPLNGFGLLGSSDGHAMIDYRLYADSEPLELESGQYAEEIMSLDNGDAVFSTAFPGSETPDVQVDEFDPPNVFEFAVPGSLGYEWHTFTAEVDAQSGLAVFFIDDLEVGFVDTTLNGGSLAGNLALMMRDPFTSLAPVSDFAFTIFDNFRVQIDDVVVPGDFNSDGELTADDVDRLAVAIRTGDSSAMFDVDGNGDVDLADHTFWIKTLKNTWLGDSNLDGEFSSTDFVFAFTSGKYEDDTPLNATWAEGDWNADGDFDSSDFVTAFTDGGYELGQRPATATVPEPQGLALAGVACVSFVVRRRRRMIRG